MFDLARTYYYIILLLSGNLFKIFHEQIDENVQHIGGQRDALRLAGGVEAEVHQEGRGVLQPVHGEVLPGEVLGHQPADQAPLQQSPPYDEPGLLQSVLLFYWIRLDLMVSVGYFLINAFRNNSRILSAAVANFMPVTYLRLSF